MARAVSTRGKSTKKTGAKRPSDRRKATAKGKRATAKKGTKKVAQKASRNSPKTRPVSNKTTVRTPAVRKAFTKKPIKKERAPILEIDPDVLEFIEALDQFKHRHGRPFPNWSEVLHVLRGLGYRKR